jgi:di/tricarboxylate transporter
LGGTTWVGIGVLTLVVLFMIEVMSNVVLVTVFVPVVSQLVLG